MSNQIKLTGHDIKQLWLEVFPNSDAVHGSILGTVCVKLYLQRQDEVANGIRENDPLGHSVWIEGDNIVESGPPCLTVKPTNPYMAYGSVKMRKTTIRNATPEKVRARFIAIKQFIAGHHAEWYLDLSDKV